MQSSFRRQFLELATGTSLAQVFSLVLMPVISRIYTPSDMGEYALYVALSSIIGLLGNFRLDLAVVLAGDEEEGSRLVWLSMLSALGISIFSYAILGCIYGFNSFTFYTAASIACIASAQPLINWHTRQKNFKCLATRNAGEKLLVLALGIALGYWGYKQFGLVASQTAGLVFSFFYLLLRSGVQAPRFARTLWRETLLKFSDFPLKNLLSSALMAFSMFLPSLLFAACFSKAQLGQYNLTSRVFDIPINLIAYTFSAVYYQHSQATSPHARRALFVRSLRLLGGIFIPIFVIGGLLGPQVFQLVFGAQWMEAGTLAQYFAPLTAARLLFISQSTLLLVQRKLTVDLGISTLLFVTQVAAFALAYFQFHSLNACVLWMSAIGTVVYLIGLGLIYRVVR